MSTVTLRAEKTVLKGRDERDSNSPNPYYQADGHGGMAYAIQNAQTVCFVDQEWDDPGDDATPEQLKTWEPKPDSLSIDCTDKQVLEQIDNRH